MFANSTRMAATTAAMILMLGLALVPTRASATLGGNADSIEKDRVSAQGIKNGVVSQNGYTVQTLRVGGTTVREYLSASGTVFAVTWNGINTPNLKNFLGGYADQYERMQKAHVKIPGRRQSVLKSDHLVVERWGHMRDLHGRAYDPALVPSGVNPNDLE